MRHPICPDCGGNVTAPSACKDCGLVFAPPERDELAEALKTAKSNVADYVANNFYELRSCAGWKHAPDSVEWRRMSAAAQEILEAHEAWSKASNAFLADVAKEGRPAR